VQNFPKILKEKLSKEKLTMIPKRFRGGIAKEKRADFLVFSSNPEDIRCENLSELKVLKVIRNGDIIFYKDELHENIEE